MVRKMRCKNTPDNTSRPVENGNVFSKDGAPEEKQKQSIQLLDTDSGLRRAMNDKALYRTLLEMFLERFTDVDNVLSGHILRSDFTEAEKYTHKLKGAASTISADALAESALRFEMAVKMMGSTAPPEPAELFRVWKMSFSEIKRYLEV